jgi:hypothetical protein
VDRDDKLNTRVHVAVASNDKARLDRLADSLSTLPQTYQIAGVPK